MNIRKTTRSACRTCNGKAYQATFGVGSQTWSTMTPDQRKALSDSYTKLELEHANRNKDNLYALEALTASGIKVEVICKTCLTDFLNEVQKEIPDIRNVRSVDETQKENEFSLDNFPIQIS